MTETLEGIVERITFYGEEQGFTVLRLQPSAPHHGRLGRDGLVTVVGNLPELQPGESARFTGIWFEDRQYGCQFRPESVVQILPSTEEGVRRFLGSGLIKGVGPRTAKRIVDYFGLTTLNVLDQDPERILEVPQVGRLRVERIKKGWDEHQAIKGIMIFLQGHGVSTGLAVKIYKFYGSGAVSQVTANPYQLAHDIDGIGFKTADKIAQNLGIPRYDSRRISAGLMFAQFTISQEGHVYSPCSLLVKTAAELLDVDPALCDAAIDPLVQGGDLISEKLLQSTGETENVVYTPSLFHSEKGTATHLLQMFRLSSSPILGTPLMWEIVFATLSEQNIKLTDQQKDAVKAAVEHPLSILTGGPGTGKTTTLHALICVLEMMPAKYKLASPTGRAAKRLSETTGKEAGTIHRLLGFNPGKGFEYNDSHPLDTDILIIDEASMLDLVLFYNVLKALQPNTHLLLVGDVDQLPSVGPGDVLKDIIRSNIAHVTRLETIFRQGSDSLIISHSHQINSGQMPDIKKRGNDFFLFQIDDPQKVVEYVVDIVKNRLPAKLGLHPLDDIQVLSPMHRGLLGVQSLNDKLQVALNPPGQTPDQRIGGRVFRVGDKVIQTQNNYVREVFNGDIGRVRSIDAEEQTVTVVFDHRTIEYDWTDLDELAHAYAISVHRSQGTEYPAIVMPIVTQHYLLLQRNLLYTAITRARKCVVLVGSKKALWIAVKNDKQTQRYSGLAFRLQTLLEGLR